MIANARNSTVSGGSIIQMHGQQGGQVAHIINNFPDQQADDKVRIKGHLSTQGDLEILKKFGCPGIEFLVVCKSKRRAKIRDAQLCVQGQGFLESLQQGFSADFRYNPPKGDESQTLFVEMFHLSTPNSSEGFVLSRDDVCRFFLPICFHGILPFLTATPDKVFISVHFFDGSERILVRGSALQETLKELLKTNQSAGYRLRTPINLGVRVTSKDSPNNLPVGLTNPNPVAFVKQEQVDEIVPPRQPKVNLSLAIAKIANTNERTIAVQVLNISAVPLPNVTLTLHAEVDPREPFAIAFVTGATGPLAPQKSVEFAFPFQNLIQLQKIVESISPERYAVIVRSNSEQLAVVPGIALYTTLLVGITNPSPVAFVNKEQTETESTPRRPKVTLSFGVAKIEQTNEFTFGIQLSNVTEAPLPNVTVTLYADVGLASPVMLRFVSEARGARGDLADLAPKKLTRFALPFQDMGQLLQIAAAVSPARYGLIIHSDSEELARVAGVRIYESLHYIEHVKATNSL